MRKFALRLTVFSMMLISSFVASYFFNTHSQYRTRLDDKHFNILIVGDSHVRRGINPKRLTNADNICQPAEPYVISFWKLQEALKRSSIDTVILGFTHHTLSSYNEMKFSDPEWSSEMFRRSYFIGDPLEIQERVEVNRIEYAKVYFRNVCVYPNLKHDTWVGEYKRSKGGDVSDPETVIARRYYHGGEQTQLSEFNMQFLDSITALCNRSNIELLLVGCPLSKGYLNQIPDEFKNAYDLRVKELNSNGIRVIDFTQAGFNDSLFINPDHLNAAGSDKLMEELRAVIYHNTM
ncbi:MAG: hypothetical protein H6603_00145 [Flavobacteriales bacterium]|nr:hypothetical protein [Flavobacteriales bacterium]